MRVGSVAGRAKILVDGTVVDVAAASDGRFSESVSLLWDRWDDVLEWARTADLAPHTEPVPESGAFDPPVPRPRQVLAVGLNYRDHAAESGMDLPTEPLVFTKFASSITGPDADVHLSGPQVDWEAELVVVVGRGGRDILRAEALDHVAGVTVGQDLSDRATQNAGRPPQFSLGKSYAGYAPIGPWVVTLDELPRRDARGLRITCDILDPATGERRRVQDSTSSDMVFGVEELIVRLSAIIELYPGDLIFTGTPAGVGIGRDPQQFLSGGLVVETHIEHIGSIRQTLR